MKKVEDLRMIIRMKQIPMWKIAEVIGISEPTLYRWMRKYDAGHYKKILDAIKMIDGGDRDDEDNQTGK